MFCGAYWSQRSESRSGAAQRIVRLLVALGEIHEAFGEWLPVKARADDTVEPIKTIDWEIEKRLVTNKEDMGGAVMPQLGFTLSLWNERGASISVTIGVTSRSVKNVVALSYKGGEPIGEAKWVQILRAISSSMDPDTALVATSEARSRNPRAPLWDVAWLRYERGHEVVERSPLRDE